MLMDNMCCPRSRDEKCSPSVCKSYSRNFFVLAPIAETWLVECMQSGNRGSGKKVIAVLQVDSKHMFAVVLTSKASARGSHYLRQHLHTEVLAQIRQQNGSVPAALRASLDGLNKGFRNLHPFNPDVLEGVRLAVVYIDFAAHRLHIISNGACRYPAHRPSEHQQALRHDACAPASECIRLQSRRLQPLLLMC